MLVWVFLTVVASGAAIEILGARQSGKHVGTIPVLVGGCFAGGLMAILVLLTARPVFAAAAVLALMVALAAVNSAKLTALREPLVFVDFAMLGQIAKHPQLFLPYLGVVPAALLLGSVVAASGAAMALEAPLQVLGGWPTRLAAVLALAAGGGFGIHLLRGRLRRWAWGLKPSLNPRTDVIRFGLIGSLLLTALLSNDQSDKDIARQRRRRTLRPPRSGKLTDIVAVQAESFFDVRRMDRRIDRSLLRCFDHCATEAVYRGQLTVPAAWGACTQRTEFAFLTGLSADELGMDRFNPYLRFAKRPVWSIAHELRNLGYQTICIHPFSGDFFGRRQVLPNLGFDAFFDVSAFQGAREFGPYVSDLAVAEKVAAVLEESARPKFIFAITMENHGQWWKERLPPEELAGVQALVPSFPAEFLCYLRHLANTDAMIGQLAHALRQRDGTLCVFGDHLPSFPKVFRHLEFSDPRSDYVIWRPDHGERPMVRDADVVGLSDLLLSAADIRQAGAAEGMSTPPGSRSAAQRSVSAARELERPTQEL